MKKKIDPPKRMMLPEVRVTATRTRKTEEPKANLYPKGQASIRQIDSLKRVGLGKAIGNPIVKSGQRPTYGASASDVIKKSLKKK